MSKIRLTLVVDVCTFICLVLVDIISNIIIFFVSMKRVCKKLSEKVLVRIEMTLD